MKKKALSVILALLMAISVIPSIAAQNTENTSKPYTVTKISNPDAGEREVDGLIAGGDRENSYTWRLAMRGDEIYIATTRNIASALVNMYGGAFSQAGIDIDTFWAMINVVTNGDIPRNDANEGANIISYNRKTGEFKVIYTADKGDYFRMAVTFGDDVYFGSYSASPANPQYILKLDTEGNFTKVFQTMGSVSLRANCEYDGHLFFAGADDRTPVADNEAAPVAKMAVLRKSNEDDSVWERVADFRDFGVTAYDSIHTSWAGAPIWELATHNGYIYATAPTTNGFVIYKGHPAASGETANTYGWYWTEVAGLNNGINNPGLSEKSGGEPGTMRSLIGSVYEYNGELYAYNFDHSFGGEASAFAGMLQQVAGKDVKASEYLFYLYDSLHNPQKVWKLNDETGKFEELTAFTELMEGTTNEYVWRLGEYDGDLYVATMDAGVFYNYLTQLTNGSFCSTSLDEKQEKLAYIARLIELIAKSKQTPSVDELKSKLLQLYAYIEAFDPSQMINEQRAAALNDYSELVLSVKSTVNKVLDELTVEMVDLILSDPEAAASFGAAIAASDLSFLSGIDSYEDIAALFTTIKAMSGTLSNDAIRAVVTDKVKDLLSEYLGNPLDKLNELYDSIDVQGIEMYLYINNAVVNDEWGFDLLRTSDGGESFEVITRSGFNDKYNYGCSAFLETEEGLYFGTCNPFYGGQLYLLTNEKAEPAPKSGILGDADGDGRVAIFDATAIQRKLANLKTESFFKDAADVDRDGSVTILDATYIQQYLASLPCPEGIDEPF